MASLVLTGAATLGISAHGAYTAGWFLAAVSAFAVSLLPLGLPVQAIITLFATLIWTNESTVKTGYVW